MVFSAAALRPCGCKGFISVALSCLLSLPLLAMHMPIFQVLGLLNDTIDEGVCVKGVTHVASGGEDL